MRSGSTSRSRLLHPRVPAAARPVRALLRIRSTATRIEALRRPSASTAEERTTLIDHVQAIKSPMLIVTGDLDTALEAAQSLRDVRPDATYVQVPGAPHNAYFEMREKWNPPISRVSHLCGQYI